MPSRYPHNRVKILDHASSAVVEAVLHREAEFGIHIAGNHHPELTAIPLTTDGYVLICREDHPLAGRRRVAWRQLAPYPLIFAGEVSGNRALLDLALAEGQVVLRSFYEVQRSSTAVGLVAQGLGAAVVPRLALQKGAYPSVRTIELTHPTVSRTLALVVRKTARLSPAAQALYDMILAQATLKP